MLVIGLTGGIGSGKTTVAELFAKYNIPIIDADKIARDLTQKDQAAFTKIVEHYGHAILNKDHSLNRKKLSTIIFNDAKEKNWLEQLLHPLIFERISLEINKLSAPYCIAMIPLLIEVEAYSFINRILVVDTDRDLQIKRVVKRDQLPAEHIEAILNSQLAREGRLSKAHDVIINNGEIEDLIPQVE